MNVNGNTAAMPGPRSESGGGQNSGGHRESGAEIQQPRGGAGSTGAVAQQYEYAGQSSDERVASAARQARTAESDPHGGRQMSPESTGTQPQAEPGPFDGLGRRFAGLFSKENIGKTLKVAGIGAVVGGSLVLAPHVSAVLSPLLTAGIPALEAAVAGLPASIASGASEAVTQISSMGNQMAEIGTLVAEQAAPLSGEALANINTGVDAINSGVSQASELIGSRIGGG